MVEGGDDATGRRPILGGGEGGMGNVLLFNALGAAMVMVVAALGEEVEAAGRVKEWLELGAYIPPPPLLVLNSCYKSIIIFILLYKLQYVRSVK